MSDEREAQRAVFNHVGDLVAEHGLAIIAVQGESPGESFSYTVGLSEQAHPDLVMYGMPPGVAHALLNAMGQRVLAGEMFSPGICDGVLANDYRLWLVPVPDDRAEEVLLLAGRWSGNPARGLQVVAPDAHGRFPREPGVDPAYERGQMVLDPDWRPE